MARCTDTSTDDGDPGERWRTTTTRWGRARWATAPDAVCDERGRVRGLTGVVVADASLMPTIPRANTNLPAVMVGEIIAATL